MCQHGLIECTGNMFQACFLNLPGVSDEQQIEVVNCIMGRGKAYDAGQANDATLRVRLITSETKMCGINSNIV